MVRKKALIENKKYNNRNKVSYGLTVSSVETSEALIMSIFTADV